MPLSLYHTTDDFKVDGISYSDIPLFVDLDTMRIEHLPTEWIIYHAIVRGRSRSPGTWEQYALSLLDWLNFVIKKGWDYRSPEEMFLAHFRNHLENRKPKRRRNTIARKMRLVCSFYEWAHDEGHVKTLPLRYERSQAHWTRNGTPRNERKRGATLSAAPVVVPRSKRDRDYKRFYTKPERELFLAELCERDRLIALWALFTGAREHEIAALECDQIPQQQVYRSRRYYPLHLRVAKNDNLSDPLYVPTWLLDATYQHIKFFGRTTVVRAATARRCAVPPAIFLGRWGTQLQPDSIYQNFVAVLDRLGIQGTFHDLRHTYAITMLDKLTRAATDTHSSPDGRNALLTLRRLMRHGDLSTLQIYVDSREFYLTDIFHDTWELPEDLWPFATPI